MFGKSLLEKEQISLSGLCCQQRIIAAIFDQKAIEQANNVSQLPGIISSVLMMPDAHSGYGFCIGGVGAFDEQKGKRVGKREMFS
jgi:tRNA-splicing ligase RtcB